MDGTSPHDGRAGLSGHCIRSNIVLPTERDVVYTSRWYAIYSYQRLSKPPPVNRIKEVLEERGIKQTWLAEKLGKSFCIVNSYVCNRRQPSLEVLFEIAKILNVNLKDLIDSKE